MVCVPRQLCCSRTALLIPGLPAAVSVTCTTSTPFQVVIAAMHGRRFFVISVGL
eukprot:COSAG05_NODE_312_length_11626_cov_9.515485_12_plen_54_part_00